MYILGISAFYHDSAACLIKDGKIIAAIQEERLSRKKHDSNFPLEATKLCLKEANITAREIDYVAFYEKPFLKFDRLFETFLAFAPFGFSNFIKALPLWIKGKLFQKNMIINYLNILSKDKIIWKDKLYFTEHHVSHAASAFFPSPFSKAAILTIDGVGEWTTTSIGYGVENKIYIDKEIRFPHSIGLLYSAFTYYLGFSVNSGEYKVMGLAPYGRPKYYEIIKKNLVKIKDDGSFQLNMKFFNFCTGLTMTNKKFNLLFDAPRRKPESPILQKHMDLAASIQEVLKEILIKICREIAKDGHKNLCLAGGVALNCVINGILLKENLFKNIWIQPASGDAGGCIGAALSINYILLNKTRRSDEINDLMNGSLLGPSFKSKDIISYLTKMKATFKQYKEEEALKIASKALSNGKIVGWMNGKMEFGPRSLGNRSILADPRKPNMQKILNTKIKYRETFRPFAPSIIEEDTSKWFDINICSPYMLFVANILKNKRTKIYKSKFEGINQVNEVRSVVPCITHLDYSSRIQTVNSQLNPKFYKLLTKFKEITDCPILVNTSFNVREEPIVCSHEDAYKCFMGTEMDLLFIENIILVKKEQILNE